MGSLRTKAPLVGTAEWLQMEKDQSNVAVKQEAEEFGYSVRNELEWLNEHMADIFSTSQVNFADIFKTPGKLRGKTPRTIRKHNAPAPTRQPLTDLFAPSIAIPPSAQKTAFLDKVANLSVPQTSESAAPNARPKSRSKSPQRVGQPGNTDSGYHGMMTEDEMDVDQKTETATMSSQQSFVQMVPLRENQPPPQRLPDVIPEGDSSTDSFTSAREELTARAVSKEPIANVDVIDHAVDPEDMEADQENVQPSVVNENILPAAEQDQDLEEGMSKSDVSSPEKPLQRKSSFTFTALPAREPLGTKRSLGLRNSQIDTQNRESTFAKSFGAKTDADPEEEEDAFVQEKSEESKMHNKTSTQLLHERITMLGKTKEVRPSKSIPHNVLSNMASYPQLPSNETVRAVATADDSDDDWIAPTKSGQHDAMDIAQGDAEVRPTSPERPAMHQKSISTTQIPSPSRSQMAPDVRHQKPISVSNPSSNYSAFEIQSTTPAGSPPRKKSQDGPLSASKSKLYSVLKSAKSIFASSASASAAAKLEAHNNSPSRSSKRDISNESKTAAVFNMPGALYSERQLPQSPSRPISMLSASPSKKSRKSDESERKQEKDLKARQKADQELEKAREKERQRAAKQREDKDRAQLQQQEQQQSERPATADSDKSRDPDMPPPPPPKNAPASGKLRAPVRLGGKPIREPTQSSKPAPVSIRVASQSQRLGQNLSKSQHEASAPPPPPPKNTVNRPGSAQGSVRSSTAPNNSRVKALAAAARKKEADEKAAQEKAEKKQELDRRRAAKAEEDRKAEEERKAAEQQRAQEVKLAAQRLAEKQAADAKRREQQRVDQLRQQEEAQRRQQEEAAQREKAKAAHELAEAIKRERAQQGPPAPRSDVVGTMRQLFKNIVPEQAAPAPTQGWPQVQTNPAKPAKRVWQAEEGAEAQRPAQPTQPQRPGLPKGPPSYHQQDAKRRRTNEEEPEAVQRHSVMAPPMRASNMRKESTLAKFPHGYAHAPQPPTHHAPAMFKPGASAQHQLQHAGKPGMPTHPSQMVQVSNARIPFAENANPPSTTQYHHPGQTQASHTGGENMHPGAGQAPNKYKTPARPPHLVQVATTTAAKSAAKSSPLYAASDAIQLPDIATDSEDEDSDADSSSGDRNNNPNNGFRAPSWVASPALRELLTQQQLVDPETVFGPIAELKMDEVFKNAKNPDRLKRLRDRGSSAAWVQSGDAVTSAEKRRDMELRERVAREGGWRYEPNV